MCLCACGCCTCTGVKINDGEGIDRLGLDRKRLARLSVESYLQQVGSSGSLQSNPIQSNTETGNRKSG